MGNQSCIKDRVLHGHPCFGGHRHKYGRMHLAVAPRCNISCGYCERKHDCANESRPGVTSRLLSPQQALEHVRSIMSDDVLGAALKVVGIAGPGDPLANEETFETYRLVKAEFPEMLLCLSTNGLLLAERVDELAGLDLHSLTITINAIDPAVGYRIYSDVMWRGRRYRGEEGASILIENQFEGVRRAARLGLVVKVNTVLMPGINDHQISLIAERVSDAGAHVMNIMPLIPRATLSHVAPPTVGFLEEVRAANETIIAQFRGCQQCRADAAGLVGGGCSSL